MPFVVRPSRPHIIDRAGDVQAGRLHQTTLRQVFLNRKGREERKEDHLYGFEGNNNL